MAAGSWTVRLSRETPARLLEQITLGKAGFGQLVILPAHLDARQHADADLLGLARYTGLYRRQEGVYALSGPGLPILMGDEDGKADIMETVRSTPNGWLSQWYNALIPLTLKPGVLTSPGGSYDGTFHLQTPKEAFELLNDQFGVEWRIRPDSSLDVGPTSALYGTVPRLILLRGAGSGGRDLSPLPGDPSSVQVLHSMVVDEAGWDEDLEDYTTKVVYVTEQEVTSNTSVVVNRGTPQWVWDPDLGRDVMVDITSASYDTITERETVQVVTTAATPEADIPYGRGTDGAPVILDRLVDAATDDGATPAQMAAMQLGRFNKIRRELRVGGGQADVALLPQVGAPVWLYSPPTVMDLANPVLFRGRPTWPVVSRLVGMTWPVTRGCGVYLRVRRNPSGPVWHDLTHYVEWEDGDLQLEVGAAPRGSGS